MCGKSCLVLISDGFDLSLMKVTVDVSKTLKSHKKEVDIEYR